MLLSAVEFLAAQGWVDWIFGALGLLFQSLGAYKDFCLVSGAGAFLVLPRDFSCLSGFVDVVTSGGLTTL